VGDDHAEPVHRAALKEAHQRLPLRAGHSTKGIGRAIQEQGVQTETDEREAAGFDECTTGDR